MIKKNIYLYAFPLTFSQSDTHTETILLIFSFEITLCSFKKNWSFQTFTERQAAKDCVGNMVERLEVEGGVGGQTHKWPEEFEQCCAQCDYLSFFHAGCSFRGHYHLILSVSHRQHTQKQVGLCHFNDSIASGALHRLCSVTLQRPMWRAPAPPLRIRPQSDESRRGPPSPPLARRGC